MNINRSEFRARPREEPAPKDEVQAVARDSVRIDALTLNQDWDWFLSFLESAIVRTEKHLEFEGKILKDPMIVNVDVIMQTKNKIGVLESRIETLKEVQRLPKFLKEHSEKAKAMIQAMKTA